MEKSQLAQDDFPAPVPSSQLEERQGVSDEVPGVETWENTGASPLSGNLGIKTCL